MMKIETLIPIAETDNGKFHQIVIPDGVDDLIFKILAQWGTIKLLPNELALEMINRKNKKTLMTHFKTHKSLLLFVVAPNKEQREKIGTL